jgi:transposase
MYYEKKIKRNFKKPNRVQLLMVMNTDLDSIAPVGGVLRTIDELVDMLDTSNIENQYDLESKKGAEPICPKTLLKVALYAIYNCRFSLRKMEADTIAHLGYQWITGNESIDHSTLGKFLAKYRNEISNLLSQVVMISAEKDLIDFDVLAIDTVKLRANASYKQFRTLEGIKKEQEKIQGKLAGMIDSTLREEKELQEKEVKALEKRKARLEDAKCLLKQRIEKKTKNSTKKEKEQIRNTEKINITDFDCYLVQQANGETNAGYAITSAADTGKDIATYGQVNEENNDPKALLPVIAGSKENCKKEHAIVDADSGFSSIDNLEKLETQNQKALIPDRRKEAEEEGQTQKNDYDRSHFKYNKNKDEYKCPEKKTLPKTAEYEYKSRTCNRYANPGVCGVTPF